MRIAETIFATVMFLVYCILFVAMAACVLMIGYLMLGGMLQLFDVHIFPAGFFSGSK